MSSGTSNLLTHSLTLSSCLLCFTLRMYNGVLFAVYSLADAVMKSMTGLAAELQSVCDKGKAFIEAVLPVLAPVDDADKVADHH